ncbi:TPA: Lar family restriction alleviation protein [Salmonella enterica subsp. diarizonae serovar 60-67:z35:-]
MREIDYVVTFRGKFPCGCRHRVLAKMKATGVSHAISIASEAIKDDRVKVTDIELLSVLPENWPPAMISENSDGLLKPCPFCGNPHVSLVEVWPELSDEILYVVNCGCCNATQHPDGKERAIHDWNQRNEA